MTDYLLFIDTEASGLPKNWKQPYSALNNWPFCVQVSWIIYTKEGKEVKSENHYIKNNDFKIARSARRIHGINREFLDRYGEERTEVMQLLADNILQYNPLVIGHFIEFDLHMLGADFFRTSIENPVRRGSTFCTMLGSSSLVKNPGLKFFKLGQLWETLFKIPLKYQHNAFFDAKATAGCFFELLKLEIINDETIHLQQKHLLPSAVPEEYLKPPLLF